MKHGAETLNNLKAGKWSLLFKALPYAAAVLLVRLILQNVFNLKVNIGFSDIAEILTATTLVVALMLSGVLVDYKESEKIPTILGRTLSNLDGLSWRGLDVIGQEGKWARTRVLEIAEAVNLWLTGQIDNDSMWKIQRGGSNIILDLEKAGVRPHYIHKMLDVNSDLGSALARIQVVRDTSYIQPGYALMQMLVGAVMCLMTIVTFPANYVEWPITGALTLLFAYLVLLVGDVDDPFEYTIDGQSASAADVDLSPFLTALERLRSENFIESETKIHSTF